MEMSNNEPSTADTLETCFAPEIFSSRIYGVTGAAHGIGYATSAALARHGARVLMIDIDEDNLHRADRKLATSGAEIVTVVADVADCSAVTAAIEEAMIRWGRLDGWVNNAFFSHRALITKQSEADFHRAWEVNCLAAWRICRRILPLLAHSHGSIVNVSSIMAHQTMPEMAAYTSSKMALEGLTRALAVEFAPHRVRVNTIMPGYIRTYEGLNHLPPDTQETWPECASAVRKWIEYLTNASQPWPEAGLPQDVANAILFLLSAASRFVTGATLTIDGGLSADARDVSDVRRGEAFRKFMEVRPSIEAYGQLLREPRMIERGKSK